VTTVTISATFGASGSVIGPAVAKRLGLPFVDRAIPAAVAAEIGCSLDEVLAHDDRAEHGLGRLLSAAARFPNVTLGGLEIDLSTRGLPTEEDLVARTEQVIRQVAAGRGGVILGRAGQLVLADEPRVLHVRLDSARARRLAVVRDSFGLPAREADRLVEDNDRARAAYVKHFYRADPADPALYHLVLDSTRLPAAACVDLVVAAADAFSPSG
jgi:cytidylate kinase